MVETDQGTLAFQEYFVREQCRPVVRDIRYEGAALARPSPAGARGALRADACRHHHLPLQPWLSVEPILAVAGMREALKASGVPIVAVSPIIGGKAVKGPDRQDHGRARARRRQPHHCVAL